MELENAVKYFLEKIQQDNDGNHVDLAVPGYLAKPLITYQSMREDLTLCLNAVNLLVEPQENQIVSTSLWHTFIILYGKCFTDASSSKSSKLEPKDCFSEGGLLVIHERLMELRHNFVAHRGSTEHEFGFAYLTMNLQTYERQARVKQIKRHTPDSEEISNYITLVTNLIRVVESKFKRAAEKTWSHMLEKFTPEELGSFKIAGPINPSGSL
jgi:hypothetical protein